MSRERARTYPVPDRWSYLWLAIGTTLSLFSSGRWPIPLAAWLGPVFLIRFIHTQKVFRGFILVWLGTYVTAVIGWWGMMPSSLPLPANLVILAISTLTVLGPSYLAYLIAALQPIEADIGRGALSTLQSPQPPSEAILTTPINEIAAIPHRVVLVLDDYHLIDARPVHDALTFLLRHLPPHTMPGGQRRGMHLVIATRDDPPLPVARLRARGQLTELRAAELRFTSAEAAGFLDQVMGPDLSARDIAALETRTEGWIAGLQLAAISM